MVRDDKFKDVNVLAARAVELLKEAVAQNTTIHLSPVATYSIAKMLEIYIGFVENRLKEDEDLKKMAALAGLATAGTWTYELENSHKATVYADRRGFSYDQEGGILEWPTHGRNLFGRLELDSNGENNLRFMTGSVEFVRDLAAKRFPVKV